MVSDPPPFELVDAAAAVLRVLDGPRSCGDCKLMDAFLERLAEARRAYQALPPVTTCYHNTETRDEPT